MREPPRPRREVFDIYWRLAYNRHRIFERRVAGEPGPWSDDPVLLTYKFCNTFRAADRVSQFLIREVAYAGDRASKRDRLFQIVAFRTFSRVETWRGVTAALGRQPTISDLKDGAFERALEAVRRKESKLYTGAFILCAADAYGRAKKHLNHVELFRDMFVEHDLAGDVLSARSLEEVYKLLHAYPLMGDFMSYQTAIDLNYSDLIDFSEDDFTRPGPGALRGLRKVFEHLGDYSPEEVIQWMVDRQDVEFKRLGLKFGGLWGRRLHAIDCQGLFCETDKYCRAVVPELKSARVRIKSKFRASAAPIRLFFPPKWGINSLLPKGPVLGAVTPTEGHKAGAPSKRASPPSHRRGVAAPPLTLDLR